MRFFFFNDTATTEIYTLSLHDALPIFHRDRRPVLPRRGGRGACGPRHPRPLGRVHQGAEGRSTAGERVEVGRGARSEEHTSELQSRQYLVCRLLLEKTKKTNSTFLVLA